MKVVFKNAICIIILAIVIYLIYLMYKPQKMIPLYTKKNAVVDPNVYLNADILTNQNAKRFQEGPLVVDRLPLVEENTHIIPANEIVPMNYKNCNALTDPVEKEIYTSDMPLFQEIGPANLVPLDLNDSTHRRVNFY